MAEEEGWCRPVINPMKPRFQAGFLIGVILTLLVARYLGWIRF